MTSPETRRTARHGLAGPLRAFQQFFDSRGPPLPSPPVRYHDAGNSPSSARLRNMTALTIFPLIPLGDRTLPATRDTKCSSSALGLSPSLGPMSH